MGPGLEAWRSETNSKEFAMDGVNYRYFVSYLYPACYNYRKPTKFPSKTSLAVARTQYTVVSDTSGNAFVWVFPWNAFNSNAGTAAFIANFIGWNSTTGSYTSAVLTAGPLNTAVANFDRARVNGAECNVTPISSSNSAGATTGAYF